ncbi:G5 domain-containing protein [Streptococcus gordonii]|uniref:G5 domain-containing protein n=1 Tax=Streptococcus gordonii TaxID=1302 RepID=UPI001C8B8C4B|nr:G5 domain-containing protein [Streptococcus gordonii]MBX9096129.1 LPXTG cell wall anchor domain-containing protein [Streptococcus gordonii]
MDRKKLIKLGISVLAVNALGAVAVYKYPELTHVPTVYAEEQPGEDEEIPDASEAQAATNFKNQMDEFEEAIKEFNPDDSDTREGLEIALGDLEASHTTAVNAIKSEEGKKGFAKYEARYQALKAKAQALLNGESPKPQPDPQPQPNPDPQPQPKITTQELTVKEPIPYGSSTEQNSALPKGTRKTKVQGVNGEKEVVYTITLTDGKETGRVKKSETVIKPAVDEVIEEGTGAVTTTEEVVEKEVIKHGSRTEQNPALPKGTRNTKVQGVDGEKEVTYTVTKEDGVQVSKVKKSEKVTKPAVDEVIEEGTGPVITTKEETKTEEVDFQVTEVPNPALPEGVRNVTTPGKKGVRTIVETVTYTDGKETGRVVKSNTITTPAVDEVVEVGTKKGVVTTTEEVVEKEVIKHGSSTVQNPALPKGTRNTKVQGVDGEKEVTYTVTKADGVQVSKVKKSETVTKPAVDEVIEEGTGPVVTTKEETKTEEVDFQVKEVPNPALPEGVRNVTTPGKKGVRTIVETVTYTDGKETGRIVKSNEITTPAVDEVVEVGTKKGVVTTTEEVVEKEVIKHGSSTVQNPALPKGTRNVKVQGVDGEKEVTYTVTKADGVQVSKVKKSETVTKPAVDEVIEEGTGPVITTKEETKTEEVDFQVKEVPNPDLPVGIRTVTTPGKKGVRTIVETVTYTDGVETGRQEKSNTITTPAVDEVVEVGTWKATAPVITTKEETKTEEVDFQVKEVQNPALPEGVRNVTTPGKKGVRTIVYTVTYADGVETGRVEKSNTITTPAVDEVVEVGTKKATAPVVTTENVTETQVIYHGTITLSNPDLPKGTKRIKIAGVDGEKTVVYTITKTNGVETSRVVRDEQITKTPITQVVEIGTKESGSSQSNAGQDQKDPSDKAQDSKGQGQKDSTGKVQDPKDQAKPGSDAATSSQSGQTDRPQQPQYSRVNRNAEEKKNLPNTGEHTNGLAALLGLVLASVTAFFNFRRKKH